MVSFSEIPYDREFPRVAGRDEQWALEDTGRSYLDNLPWTVAGRVVSLSKASARYFVRCILRTRTRHVYNYCLELMRKLVGHVFLIREPLSASILKSVNPGMDDVACLRTQHNDAVKERGRQRKREGWREGEVGIMSTHTQGVAHRISSFGGDRSYILSWCDC